MTGAPCFDARFRRELDALFRWRRDVRCFQTAPIVPELVCALLESACQAPSVGLSEPWRFVMVDDPVRRGAIRDDFARCNAQALACQPESRSAIYARLKLAGLDDAPCHIAVFADPGTNQGHGLGRFTMPETIAYSVVMAVHTLWLAARAYGLGLGWVSILDPARVATVLEVNPNWIFIGYLCLGYPEAESDTPELERAGWERRRSSEPPILKR